MAPKKRTLADIQASCMNNMKLRSASDRCPPARFSPEGKEKNHRRLKHTSPKKRSQIFHQPTSTPSPPALQLPSPLSQPTTLISSPPRCLTKSNFSITPPIQTSFSNSQTYAAPNITVHDQHQLPNPPLMEPAVSAGSLTSRVPPVRLHDQHQLPNPPLMQPAVSATSLTSRVPPIRLSASLEFQSTPNLCAETQYSETPTSVVEVDIPIPSNPKSIRCQENSSTGSE